MEYISCVDAWMHTVATGYCISHITPLSSALWLLVVITIVPPLHHALTNSPDYSTVPSVTTAAGHCIETALIPENNSTN